MNLSYPGRYMHHGFMYFFYLMALAMVQLTSFYVLLPLCVLAVAAYVCPRLEHANGYLSIALTVCKNE